MLRRHPIALFCLTLLLGSSCFAEEKPKVKIIEPKKQNEAVKSASIDSERFQMGFYLGTLAVEDFNKNFLGGLSFTYIINKQFIVQGNYAVSDVDKSTLEERSGLSFIADEDRELSYFNVLGGYKLYTARSFLGSKNKFDSDVYLMGGIGSIEFAGNSATSTTLGLSYRVVFTDWFVASIDFRDHMAKIDDAYGRDTSKLTQNLELSIGLNAMF